MAQSLCKYVEDHQGEIMNQIMLPDTYEKLQRRTVNLLDTSDGRISKNRPNIDAILGGGWGGGIDR